MNLVFVLFKQIVFQTGQHHLLVQLHTYVQIAVDDSHLQASAAVAGPSPVQPHKDASSSASTKPVASRFSWLVFFFFRFTSGESSAPLRSRWSDPLEPTDPVAFTARTRVYQISFVIFSSKKVFRVFSSLFQPGSSKLRYLDMMRKTYIIPALYRDLPV